MQEKSLGLVSCELMWRSRASKRVLDLARHASQGQDEGSVGLVEFTLLRLVQVSAQASLSSFYSVACGHTRGRPGKPRNENGFERTGEHEVKRAHNFKGN